MVPMKLTIQTARPYSVILENGLLDRVGEMALQTRKPGSQAMLISETNVYPLYGERVKASLEKAGFAVSTFVFPAGEASKQLSTVLEMYSALARQGFTRTDFIVTLGGGVTGDMGGFAAATFLRGMPFLQVPTTLLSQVDASVGGKTGVDLPVGKNLVGAFHQPEAVLTDPETLATLPERFFRDGMGEVIKYGCIRDDDFFWMLDRCGGRAGVMEHIEQVIYTCCDLKRQVVLQDERDTGLRMTLNFGHTIGHAFELAGHYETWTHGQGVAAGMSWAARLGVALGVTPPEVVEQIQTTVEKFGLPIDIPCPWETMVEAVGLDKKRSGDSINLILLTRLGRAVPHRMKKDELLALLEPMLGR